MKFKLLLSFITLLFVGSANAALIHFDGEIDYHNDVIFINFTLDDDATDVRVWTDSFLSGVNFDPITALWSADGSLISQNDDDSSINPATQTIYDSGFALSFLAAGDYIFSVATYNNFASGSTLSEGFIFDSQDPIALEIWSQPASSVNMGHYWSVWLDGVDSAVGPASSVPEPSSMALLLIAGLGFASRKKFIK